MILGVDHVALSCARIEEAARALEELGFATRFIQRDVLNHERKRAMLTEYTPLHSIAYCQGKTGVAIELTQHSAALVPGPSPYEVLLQASSPAFVEEGRAGLWGEALAVEARAVRWPALEAELWASDGEVGVRAVLLRVAELEGGARLWRDGLQFKEEAAGETAGRRWRRLGFRTPVASWALQVVLAEDATPGPAPTLDAAGFPCVALLSSNIERDGERLVAAGARDPSGSFSLEVDGKPLKVALFRGANGELLELIEAARR